MDGNGRWGRKRKSQALDINGVTVKKIVQYALQNKIQILVSMFFQLKIGKDLRQIKFI